MTPVYIYLLRDPGREAREACFQRAVQRYAQAAGVELQQPLRKAGPGKPRLLGQEGVHFSISHSGGLWACVFGDRPLGLDLQRLESERQCAAIARRFFHPAEQAYLAERGPEAFFQIWTAKESLVKQRGTGIAGDFRLLSVVEDGALASSVAGLELRQFPMGPGWFLCLCGQGLEKAQLMDLRDE